VAQAIGRIREFYPPEEQPNISSLLARNLNSIVCQRLIPNVEGTRTPCVEIMKRDAGTSQAILAERSAPAHRDHRGGEPRGHALRLISTCRNLLAGIVSEETARAFAINRHRLDLALRGILTQQAILEPDPNR
jgi:Tfp pilus assembly pilus retraction ATPase PilT